jgi:methionine-rich copper-binding protein CopC
MRKFVAIRILARAVAVAMLFAAPADAIAHAFLDNATPKVGSVVTAPPKTIRIQFTQRVEVAFSHIHLFAPGGQEVAMGPAATDPADQTQLSAPVTGALVPGQYEVRWDVLSVDTHRTNGHFPFTYQP